jgi:predicted TIM-barrel fold metal-dependent hydrolase
MAAANVKALRIFPSSHRFLANRVSLADWLDPLVERRVPLFLSVRRGMTWEMIYDLLADAPDLVCVICDHGCWGMDRQFRPLLETYRHVHIDISQYLLDAGLEALVTDYGAERVLFGSGFPESYMGGMMMALRHARIPEAAKTAIAGGNLERILEEVQL